MGPKRKSTTTKSNRTRSTPYNPEILENWTLARLREELTKRNTSLRSNTRRMVLVRLIRDGDRRIQDGGDSTTTVNLEMPEVATHNASVLNNVPQDGGAHTSALVDLVSSLTDTVASLQESYNRVETKLDQLSRPRDYTERTLPRPLSQAAAAAGSEAQLQIMSSENRGQHIVFTGSTSAGNEDFTLDSAYRSLNERRYNDVSMPYDNLDRSLGSRAVRTTYGYAAHSLPLVETVSPSTRQNIISDEKIQDPGPRSRQSTNTLSRNVSSHDELNVEVDKLWCGALSESTKSTYKSALNCFLTFVLMLGISFPKDSLPSLDADLLILFVTHCKTALKLKHDTIKLYLSGIRFHYIQSNLGDPTNNTLRLSYILRAIKKSQVLRVGVASHRYVSHEHAHHWLLHGVKDTRGRAKPTLQEAAADISDKDGTTELGTNPHEDPVQRETTSTSPMDITELPSHGTQTSEEGSNLRTRSRLPQKRKLDETEEKEDFYKSTYEKVLFIPRPWRKPEGWMNRQLFVTLLKAVCSFIILNPGCDLKALHEKFSPILQPVSVVELLEVLVVIGAVKTVSLRKTGKPSLFSPRSKCTVQTANISVTSPDYNLLYDATIEAILRIGQFSQFVLQQHKLDDNM